MEYLQKKKIINIQLIFIFIITFSYINSLYYTLNIENGYCNSNINIGSPILFKLTTDKEYKGLNLKLLTKYEDSIVRSKILFYENDKSATNLKDTQESKNGLILMNLNNSQIKEDVYFKVECDNYECNCNFEILAVDKIESTLVVGKKFIYPVTNDKKEVIFNIKENSDIRNIDKNYEKYYVNIEIKGNKQIKSKLEGGNFENKPKNNFNNNFYDFKML